MKKIAKTVTDLALLCESFLASTATFCEGMEDREKMVVYAAVQKSFLNVPRSQLRASQEVPAALTEKTIEAQETAKEAVKECAFNPDKNGECYAECKKNDPGAFKKCLQDFVEKVEEKTSTKKEAAEEKKPKENDFWGYEVGKNTAKFNEVLSKGFCSKEDLAEEFDTTEQNIAVHLSKLKQKGFLIKQKTKGDTKYYKLTFLRSEENAE